MSRAPGIYTATALLSLAALAAVRASRGVPAMNAQHGLRLLFAGLAPARPADRNGRCEGEHDRLPAVGGRLFGRGRSLGACTARAPAPLAGTPSAPSYISSF
jgi:hypothetical protein